MIVVSRFSGFDRFWRSLVFAVPALAVLLSCGENPTTPYGGDPTVRSDGLIELHFSYADSVRYGSGSDWVTYELPANPVVVANMMAGGQSASFIAPTSNATYTVSAVPFTPEAAPTLNIGPTSDFSALTPVPIGFTFNFFGNSYTTLTISREGLVQFGTPTKDGCCWGWFIPRNDDINNVIALGWSAWTVGFVSKPIRYETRGTSPNRLFVLQYNNIPEDGGSGHITSQLVLYEHTNEIAIYTTQLNTSVRRHSLTQGIENAAGNEAYFVAGRDSALFALTNDGVKFAPVAKNTPPVITTPSDVSINTDAGVCSSSSKVSAPAFKDDAPGATIVGVRSDNLPLDAPYQRGATTITWTATDIEGLKSSATQTVTVSDKEAPTLKAPDNITVRSNIAVTFATVNIGTATLTSDNCHDATVTASRSDAQMGAGFPPGVTTVTWTAKDAAGNSTTATQTVTVTQNVAPSLVVPPDLEFNTDARACVATIASIGTPVYKDDLGGVTLVGVRDDKQPLTAPYKFGRTTVTWTATDVDGASVSADQHIVVNDKEAPSVDAVSSVSVRQDRGVPHAAVALTQPGASDNCPNVVVTVSRSDNAPLNAVYQVGTTTVTWTATDNSSNVSKVSQTVTVVGNVPPVVTPAANIVANTDPGVCAAAVKVATPSVTDDIEGWSLAAARNDGQPLNAAYPKGVTTVTWTATDYDYATSSANQTVTVQDKEKPTITAPRSLSVVTDRGLPSAVVATGSPSVEENCPLVRVEGRRSDGAPLAAAYPVGVTTITWTATDASSNSASALQTIAVRDTEAPSVVVPNNFSVNATSPSGAVVTYSVTASDNVGVVSLVCEPRSGSVVGIGYKDINCAASDAAGNTTRVEFGVEVLGASEQIANLIAYVQSLHLANGVENPLVNQLKNADKNSNACSKMDDFIHLVSVKSGSFSSAQGSFMVGEARRIQAVLGCAGAPPPARLRSASFSRVNVR